MAGENALQCETVVHKSTQGEFPMKDQSNASSRLNLVKCTLEGQQKNPESLAMDNYPLG